MSGARAKPSLDGNRRPIAVSVTNEEWNEIYRFGTAGGRGGSVSAAARLAVKEALTAWRAEERRAQAIAEGAAELHANWERAQREGVAYEFLAGLPRQDRQAIVAAVRQIEEAEAEQRRRGVRVITPPRGG